MAKKQDNDEWTIPGTDWRDLLYWVLALDSC